MNTHVHFDHASATPRSSRLRPGPLIAHESAAAETVPHHWRGGGAAVAGGHDRADEIAETPIVPADTTFCSVTAIDLGDRAVELVHPGRGHTDGDFVVRLEDADILLAGDLVEESGMPSFGDDSYPLEWPWALDLVLELLGPETVVVPGHGAPVSLDFVQAQRSAIGVVAQTIRDLAGSGVPVDRRWSDPVALSGRTPRHRRTTWLRAAAQVAKRLPLA